MELQGKRHIRCRNIRTLLLNHSVTPALHISGLFDVLASQKFESITPVIYKFGVHSSARRITSMQCPLACSISTGSCSSLDSVARVRWWRSTPTQCIAWPWTVRKPLYWKRERSALGRNTQQFGGSRYRSLVRQDLSMQPVSRSWG